jgi:hypothetical protein
LSNAAGLSLIAVIAYSGFFVFRKSLLVQAKQVFLVLLGFCGTVLLILWIMKITGHYSIYSDSLKILKEIGSSKENSHGLINLIKTIVRDYSAATIRGVLPLVSLLLLCSSLSNYYAKNEKQRKAFYQIYILAFVLFLTFVIYKFGTLSVWIYIILQFAGLSALTSVLLAFKKTEPELKLLSLAGLLMTISLILGSDYGIPASGSTALWIGFPIAVKLFLEINSFSFSGDITTNDSDRSLAVTRKYQLGITESQLRNIKIWGIYTCIFLLCFHALFFTYNDNPDRTKMSFPINNPFLKGVLTTRERAKAVNELLEESSKYVRKNDFVLTYMDLPMFYVLTQTRPFLKNPWPLTYDNIMMNIELNKASAEKNELPVVVCQKVNLLSNNFWPNNNNDSSSFDLNAPVNESFKTFLIKNNYQIVWENIAFQIYTSGKKQITILK